MFSDISRKESQIYLGFLFTLERLQREYIFKQNLLLLIVMYGYKKTSHIELINCKFTEKEICVFIFNFFSGDVLFLSLTSIVYVSYDQHQHN